MDDLFLWILGGVLLFGGLMYMVITGNQQDHQNCMAYCKPNPYMIQAPYKSSNQCYCKVDGGYLMQNPNDWKK